MSPQSRSRSRARSGARRPAPPRRTPWIWFALGAVVVVAGIIAIIASRDTDGTSTPAGVEQTRPVDVTGSALPVLPDAATDPAVGQPIPELHGHTFDDTPISITRDGRAKLVLFVAHWCPHCQREVPLLVDYLESHSLPDNVDLVTVATGTTPDRPNYPPSAWLERERWPAPVLVDDADGTAAQAFGLPGYPYFVAVDASGTVVARTSGEITTDQFAALAGQAA